MNKRDVKTRIRKIKERLSHNLSLKREAEQQREILFAEVLSELDQEYEKLITLVRVAKYEIVMQELLNKDDGDTWSIY
jgi:hypothetical protein